ncbi:histidinol-phosphatase [Spirochaetota bacterium]
MPNNYHSHCDYCDGKTSAEEMAKAAHDYGIGSLGFSSHAPLPFYTPWNMDADRLSSYQTTVSGLADKYKGKMEVLCGLEIDYIEAVCSPTDRLFSTGSLDYQIAAIHLLSAPNNGNATKSNPKLEDYFIVDDSAQNFAANFKKYYADNPWQMAEDYYHALASCIRNGGFDILAHFDLLRKNNRDGQYFNESSEHYRSLAMLAVDALEGTDIIVEINTGAMARYGFKSPYPEGWILKELYSRKIDICVNSDAHSPGQLLAFRNEGLKAAREAGFNRLVKPGKSGRSYTGLE